jgi:hypothetical protein
MKKLIISILIGSSLVVSACNMTPLQQSAVQTVLQIGLRVAVAKIAESNPGIAPYLQIVGQSLKDPAQSIEPAALEKYLSDIIDSKVEDANYNQALHDLAEMINEFYAQVYNNHSGEMTDSVYLEIISAFGDAIYSGTIQTVSGPVYKRVINETMIIVE